MMRYVTGIQRLCVAEDIFYWANFNIVVEGEQLLVSTVNGNTTSIGAHEIQVAFGADHSEAEEFRAVKMMQKQLRAYRPAEYLPETVETNTNKVLASGQPYEEVLFYREAAPYGPTYYLMSIICELFWCNGRTKRFSTPMVYAYMRSLHGNQTNWSKAILHSLKVEIGNLQRRAQSRESKAPFQVIWAPVLMQLMFAYRRSIFAGTTLEEAEGWVGWTHVKEDKEVTLLDLHTKFPSPITDLPSLRQRVKIPDTSPVAQPASGGSNTDPAMNGAAPTASRKRKNSPVSVVICFIESNSSVYVWSSSV
ncbi:hypothetical protein R1sor_014448 [Riccia sorocarpa]|uniref:Uncharacterized protein n=1 Tax=Riccia sorocarpa TaxID=122646 RepID=A0ABD3HCA7_9MARC